MLPRPSAERRTRDRVRHTRIAAIASAALLAACAGVEESVLENLPRPRIGADQPPLIVIPGLLASRLADGSSGRRVWPPNLRMLIGGWRMRDLAIPVPYRTEARSARLTPTDVLLSRPRRDYYSGLLEALAAVGYDCEARGNVDADTNCVLFSWDWRRGFVSAAAELDRLVEELRELRGAPDIEIDVVGHSAGALVARYFARYGGADLVDGDTSASSMPPPRNAAAVRRMVLVGPPNRGSVYAAGRLMRGYPLGVISVQPEVLATFESAYQLLPHPDRSWLIDVDGDILARDLYDPGTWREYGISIFDPEVRARVAGRAESADAAAQRLRALEQRFGEGLERAERFHTALAPGTPKPHTELLVLGSDCEPTPRHVLVETVDGRPRLRLDPAEVEQRVPGVDYAALMRAPGDGRVTRASMLALDGAEARSAEPSASEHRYELVCERHSEMTSNTRVRRATLEFLLR